MDTVKARILVRRDTTANWNADIGFIPMRGEVIIYTDHGQVSDGNGGMVYVPGIKIGDGSAYLIDLPFAGSDVVAQLRAELAEHIGDTDIHVTEEEKTFWNNKLNYQINNGNLILTRL